MRLKTLQLSVCLLLPGCADALPTEPAAPAPEDQVGASPEFVTVTAGTFMMGSSPQEPGHAEGEAQHEVTLTRALQVQTTEVTQAQWREVIGNEPSSNRLCGEDCPVESVSWWDALYYLNVLSAQQGLRPCYGMGRCQGEPGVDLSCQAVAFEGPSCEGWRLPTEAEWEYLARAGTRSVTYAGNLTDALCADQLLPQIAWYCGTSGERLRPVGQLAPNAWGLFDTSGGVWEWVWDWYTPLGPEPATDPLGPHQGQARVVRGGGWFSFATDCRAARRGAIAPQERNIDVGFRAVRTLSNNHGQWAEEP